MNEGVGYHLDHNGYNKVSLVTYKKGAEMPHNDFTDRTIFNPSSVFEKKDRNEFTVVLEDTYLLFDTNQLNKSSKVTFELKKR